MIGLHNYEIWFIDFLDGKLTPIQEKELHTFLEQHPDLESELTDMAKDLPTVSSPDEHVPMSLNKKIVPVDGFTESNYEDFFVAYHENDLDEVQKKQLNDFLAYNPILVNELNYLGKVRVSHKNEVFPNKDRIKKSPVIIPMFRYAAAASVAILLGMGVFKFIGVEQDTPASMALEKMPFFMLPEVDNYMSYVAPTKDISERANNKTKVVDNHMEIPVVNPELASITAVDAASIENIIIQRELAAMHKQSMIIASSPSDDALSFAQLFGKVIGEGIGENGLSEGLQNEQKITGGDVADFAALAFKNSSEPLLVTSGKRSAGDRRVKLSLGVFEAEFAVR